MEQIQINKNELENLILVQNKSYESIGKLYGISGAAIKKKAKKLGIEIPHRRVINPKENFSHKKEKPTCYVDNFSDKDFIEIIKSSSSWKEIGVKFGYKSKVLSPIIKDNIEKRCEKLDIELCILKINDISYITKAELFERHPSWTSARCSIQKYAKRVFAEYGLERKCAVCGYDKHVDIAHIKAVSEFDDNATIEEINNPNNLIGLCPNHHWEYDHGLLNLEDFLDTKNKKFEKDDIIK